MVNVDQVDHLNQKSIYKIAHDVFRINKQQVHMDFLPHNAEGKNSEKAKFNSLLHLKEVADALS